MHDELMERLTAAKPATETHKPDAQLLDEILMTAPGRRRGPVTPLRLASVAAVAAALVAVLLVVPRGADTPVRTQRPTLHMRRIVASTNAAFSSGRAHVRYSSTSDGPGMYPNTAEFVVEFSGDDRAMAGTIDPGDGRGSAFAIANKVVAGQFFLQDGTRWVKDTNASDLSGSDVFSVDPRNFLAGVADAAQFAEVGHGSTRHLKATRLDGIPDFNLGLGRRGDDATKLTSFELWVDDADVVRALLVTSSKTEQTYPNSQTVITKDAQGNVHKTLGDLGDPVTVTTKSAYRVDFTDLGSPIVITAPLGAVAVAGKG